jgi:hypothetical protein
MSNDKPSPADGNSLLRKMAAYARTRNHPPPKDLEAPPAGNGTYLAPSRTHRKAITTWQDALAVHQLKELSLVTGKPQQKLIAEALNELFVKHGKKPVAS